MFGVRRLLPLSSTRRRGRAPLYFRIFALAGFRRRISRAIACLACCRTHNGGEFDPRFRLRLIVAS